VPPQGVTPSFRQAISQEDVSSGLGGTQTNSQGMEMDDDAFRIKGDHSDKLRTYETVLDAEPWSHQHVDQGFVQPQRANAMISQTPLESCNDANFPFFISQPAGSIPGYNPTLRGTHFQGLANQFHRDTSSWPSAISHVPLDASGNGANACYQNVPTRRSDSSGKCLHPLASKRDYSCHTTKTPSPLASFSHHALQVNVLNSLQESARTLSFEDTGSPLSHHSTFRSSLVNHPQQGYDSILPSIHFGANVHPSQQQPETIPLNAEFNQGLIWGPLQRSASSLGSPLTPVSVVTPGPSTEEPLTEAAAPPQQQPAVRRKTPRSPLAGTQFDYCLQTGQPLPSGRIKRTMSASEKSKRQLIIDSGGSCDACSKNHRGVLYLSLSYTRVLTLHLQCEFWHPLPTGRVRSKSGMQRTPPSCSCKMLMQSESAPASRKRELRNNGRRVSDGLLAVRSARKRRISSRRRGVRQTPQSGPPEVDYSPNSPKGRESLGAPTPGSSQSYPYVAGEWTPAGQSETEGTRLSTSEHEEPNAEIVNGDPSQSSPEASFFDMNSLGIGEQFAGYAWQINKVFLDTMSD
jgi:hypothetical protein